MLFKSFCIGIISFFCIVPSAFPNTNQIIVRVNGEVYTEYDIKVFHAILEAYKREKITNLDFLSTYAYSHEKRESFIDVQLLYQDAVKLRLVKRIPSVNLERNLQEFKSKFASKTLSNEFFERLDLTNSHAKDMLNILATVKDYFTQVYRIDVFAHLDEEVDKKVHDVFEGYRKKYSVVYPITNEKLKI